MAISFDFDYASSALQCNTLIRVCNFLLVFKAFSKHDLSQKQSPFLFLPFCLRLIFCLALRAHFCAAHCVRVISCCILSAHFCAFMLHNEKHTNVRHILCLCSVHTHIYPSTLFQFPIRLLATNSTISSLPTLLCPFFQLPLLLNLPFPGSLHQDILCQFAFSDINSLNNETTAVGPSVSAKRQKLTLLV